MESRAVSIFSFKLQERIFLRNVWLLLQELYLKNQQSLERDSLKQLFHRLVHYARIFFSLNSNLIGRSLQLGGRFFFFVFFSNIILVIII